MCRQFHHHLLALLAVVVIGPGASLANPVSPSVSPSAAQPAQPAFQPLAPPTADELKAAGPILDEASPAAKLRDLLAGDSSRLISRKDDRQGVEAFYRGRNFAPLWSANGVPNAKAKAVIAYLRGVDADGLDPSDYPVPAFRDTTAQGQAEDDLKLTNSVLAFARHARTGRVNFTRVSAAIAYDLQYPDPAEVLGKLAETNDVRAAFDSYLPQHPGYKALKAKLAELRGAGGGQARIEKSPPPATSSKKTKKGREARGSDQFNATASDSFNGSKRIEAILATLERWRWMPRDLGQTHVMVNVPDYTLKVVNQNRMVWSTRIVAGKPGEQATPLFSETMKFITVNPTWNVPPSIIRNEYMPALARDPYALERIGLKVKRKRDGTIHVYQPPGPRNALGRIRFNFPNPFLVYQHDTPSKHLFARAERAYSHGCMRVQDPETYAEVLLSLSQPQDRITADRIRGLYGDSERNINLKTPIPVHLTYQTAFVDSSGQLQLRRDVYGRDAELLRVLRDQRAVADIPIGRGHNAMARAASR